jgi:DNA-binding CsgD family transcriptional regulator
LPAREAELLRLALTAHEAASDPPAWPRFLKECAQALGADITLLQHHYLSARRSQLLATFGMVPRFTESYNLHYSRVNVWRNHSRELYVTGRIVFDEEQYPRSLLKRTEFYNDCLLPIRGTRCCAGVIERRGDVVLMLTALRDEPREPFGSDQAKTLEFLLPHLARAFITHERLQVLEAGETALNALGLGVGLLDAEGHVLFCNRAAFDILRGDDGIVLRNGRLAASNPNGDAALQKILQYAIAPGESLDCPDDVLVARPSGRRPYHLTASPLRRMPTPFVGIGTPVALVLITDPEQHRPVGIEALRHAYCLTAREAALAMTLAEGRTLRRAAEHLDIRYETARTHLRRILNKTGTSRQAELIGLLERISRQPADRA